MGSLPASPLAASTAGVPPVVGGKAKKVARFISAETAQSPIKPAAAWLLFDQALLLEGVPLKDPATFVQRLNRVLNQSI